MVYGTKSCLFRSRALTWKWPGRFVVVLNGPKIVVWRSHRVSLNPNPKNKFRAAEQSLLKCNASDVAVAFTRRPRRRLRPGREHVERVQPHNMVCPELGLLRIKHLLLLGYGDALQRKHKPIRPLERQHLSSSSTCNGLRNLEGEDQLIGEGWAVVAGGAVVLPIENRTIWPFAGN